MSLSLIEFLLLLIVLLLATIAFNTLPERLRSQLGTSIKYVTLMTAITAGFWFLLVVVLSP